MRFLISRLSSLGDVVCTLPVAVALKRRFPHCEIVWVVDPRFADAVRACSAVNEAVVTKPRFDLESLPSLTGEFDAALDMQGLLKSAVIVGRAKARQKLGFHWQREGAWLFSAAVRPDPTSLHVVDQYLDVARELGAEMDRAEFGLTLGGQAYSLPPDLTGARSPEGGQASSLPPDLTGARSLEGGQDYSLPPDLTVARSLQGGQAHSLPPDLTGAMSSERQAGSLPSQGFAVINAGAGWVSKRWPAASFARVIGGLAEARVPVLLVGGADAAAQEAGGAVEAACREFGAPLPVSLVGKTSIAQLIAVISRAAAHLGGDTGSTHIAAALGVPAVGLYSITRPERCCPYGQIERTHYDPVGLQRINPEPVLQSLLSAVRA